jgi:hypothetical protein
MGQSPSWETNSHPHSQKVLYFLWNPVSLQDSDTGPSPKPEARKLTNINQNSEFSITNH